VTLHLHRKPDLEFDGFLGEPGDSPGLLCDCRIWLAKDAAEDAWVEITVPAETAVWMGPGALNLTGTIGEDREILLSGLWISEAPAGGGFPARLAGRRHVRLSHIDRITERYRFKTRQDSKDEPASYAMSFDLTDCKYLSPAKVVQTSYTGGVTIRTSRRIEVVYPKLGKLTFERYYQSYQRDDIRGSIHTSSLVLEVLEPSKELLEDIEGVESQIGDVCLLASLAARHRVMVLGAECSAPRELYRSWINPLRRHRPPARSESPERLIGLSDFEDYFAIVAGKFCSLSDRDRARIREAIYPLVPAFAFDSVETAFLSMFSAVEALVRIEQPDVVGGPTIVDEERWQGVKREIRKVINSLGAEFSSDEKDAIRQKIAELNRPSIKSAINRFLSLYSIPTDDLWPIFGSPQMPGLAEVRNRLAHGDAPSEDALGALGVAQSHLTILLERCLLSALGYPVERSRARPSSLQLEALTDQQQIRELQQTLGRRAEGNLRS
jgi:hypothetical protein